MPVREYCADYFKIYRKNKRPRNGKKKVVERGWQYVWETVTKLFVFEDCACERVCV